MTISKLGATLVLDRAEGIRQILDAFTRAKGNRTKAAALLQVPLRSLHYYVKTLGLLETVDALCLAEGFAVKHGAKRKV